MDGIEMKKGMVSGVLLERSKARSREEWEAMAGDLGKEAAEILSNRPGFQGIMWFWDNSNSGDVLMFGVWEGLDTRVSYEDSMAEAIRSKINPLFEKKPVRPQFTLTHCYPATKQP